MCDNHRAHAFIEADKLPAEDDVDQFARVQRTHRLRLQELIIQHSQVITDFSAHDHILHEVLHRRRIFMIHFHMLCFVVNNICIQICKFFFRKCIFIIQIHQHRLRNQIVA